MTRGAGPRSEAQVHLADDEPGVADVDAVVVPIRIALALEVEAIERVAASDVEADVFEVEAHAGVQPHLAIEELVPLVLAVGAVEVVAVPLESAVGAQRLEDLPGDARAHRPERIVLGLQGEGLERLVPGQPGWKCDDPRGFVRRPPPPGDPPDPHGATEHRLLAPAHDSAEPP